MEVPTTVYCLPDPQHHDDGDRHQCKAAPDGHEDAEYRGHRDSVTTGDVGRLGRRRGANAKTSPHLFVRSLDGEGVDGNRAARAFGVLGIYT